METQNLVLHNRVLLPQNEHVWPVPNATDYICSSLTFTLALFRAYTTVVLSQEDWAPQTFPLAVSWEWYLGENSFSIGYDRVGRKVEMSRRRRELGPLRRPFAAAPTYQEDMLLEEEKNAREGRKTSRLSECPSCFSGP